MAGEIFTEKNFEEEVLKEEKPVLVDFFASWCVPCQMMGPMIEELALEYKDQVKVGKLDVEESQQIARKYGVMSIPTLIIFKEGQIVEQLVGLLPKDKIKEKIDSVIKAKG
jgi:thioredoxin 1